MTVCYRSSPPTYGVSVKVTGYLMLLPDALSRGSSDSDVFVHLLWALTDLQCFSGPSFQTPQYRVASGRFPVTASAVNAVFNVRVAPPPPARDMQDRALHSFCE